MFKQVSGTPSVRSAANDVAVPVALSSSLHPLKVLRGRHNLTQRMLADFTQLSLSTIERAERGLPLHPYPRRQLCDYFGKSVEELGLAIFYPKAAVRRRS